MFAPIQGFPNNPFLRRMMVFIDGENIICRYQHMVKNGKIPRTTVIHENDVYVWEKNITENQIINKHEIIRATYYTYIVGDDNRKNEIEERIKMLEYVTHFASDLPNKLYPCLFKKDNKSRSGKGVDIQMTVDILNNIYRNNIDTVYLISGDGDYFPVINEVIRSGKQIYLAAFSSGLDTRLIKMVDAFLDLDKICFQ